MMNTYCYCLGDNYDGDGDGDGEDAAVVDAIHDHSQSENDQNVKRDTTSNRPLVLCTPCSVATMPCSTVKT